MVETIISSGATLVVCLINGYFQQKATEKKHEETITLIEYKLDELSKRVDKHNSVVERTYHLEEQQAVTDEKLRVANHRIEDLEKEKKG